MLMTKLKTDEAKHAMERSSKKKTCNDKDILQKVKEILNKE